METTTSVETGIPEASPQARPEVGPKRARGEGRIWKISRTYWIQFYDGSGRQIRESSHSSYKQTAEKLLKQRLGEVRAGVFSRTAARMRYEKLRDALLADYATNGRKWLTRDGKLYELAALDEFFAGYRAASIGADAIRAFIRKRQAEKATNGTINRQLALLRRMFRLAVKDGKLRLVDVPHFPMLKEGPPRKGFLEYPDYQRLRDELPEHLRSVLAMGYFTGMRLGEIRRLRWDAIDLDRCEARLDPGETKSGDGRTIPLASELTEMLKFERLKHPDAETVFDFGGETLRNFYKGWIAARQRAELPGLLFHDLRRSGVRNLVRAGVPERVAMAISGHKTRSVFERYNIVSGRDLKDAVNKLETYLLGQIRANSGQTTEAEQSGAPVTQ